MPSYNISILGLEISFKTEADQKRVSEAKRLLEQRFKGLDERGRILNKEKILTLLALSLADDLLQSLEKRDLLEEKIEQLIRKTDGFDSRQA
ncbi:MAG: cell division protein ZapA [Desulfovibrionales bacterium]